MDDGLAASADSVITTAGDEVLASPVSLIMIHNPIISMIDEVKESIINAYEINTNLSRYKISNMMTNKTWMNANKVIELGFVDSIIDRKNEVKNIEMPSVSASYSPVKVMNTSLTKMVKNTESIILLA